MLWELTFYHRQLESQTKYMKRVYVLNNRQLKTVILGSRADKEVNFTKALAFCLKAKQG